MEQKGEEGQVISLDLPNVHFLPYMDVKGDVMHIYSQRSNNSLQAMEIHGIFHPHLQQMWVGRECYSHCSEYYLSPYKVNILMGLDGSICPIFGINTQGYYIGHLDLLFTYYLQGYHMRNNLRHSEAPTSQY